MKQTSRERMIATINGQTADHIPLLCWCFGARPPKRLTWERDGHRRTYWYSMRLEHIHTLPQPWDVYDDMKRAKRWLAMGIDDVLEVSLPWRMDPRVGVRDWVQAAQQGTGYPRLFREYDTPAGPLRHVVRKTDEHVPDGWVVKHDHVPLIDDLNIPRATKHALTSADDLAKIRFLLRPASDDQLERYRERIAVISSFCNREGVLAQGWGALGFDLIIWLCGVEWAVLSAMTEPALFAEIVEMVTAFDLEQTRRMLDVGGLDMIVGRGWYSSTDFWSPSLFRRWVVPYLRQLVEIVHQAGLPFAYTMTTGLLPLADDLLEAGVDLLYYVDPVQDSADLDKVQQKIAGRLTLAGGVNSGITLASGNENEIRAAVHQAVSVFGQTGRFILAPVDALFPDTPWHSVETLISAWKETAGVG